MSTLGYSMNYCLRANGTYAGDVSANMLSVILSRCVQSIKFTDYTIWVLCHSRNWYKWRLSRMGCIKTCIQASIS